MNDSGGHVHDMAPPSSNGTMQNNRMVMHMTFFWGKNAEILFNGWPGYNNLGMYILALAVVFFLALFVEWLSHCRILGREDSAMSVMARTVMYAVRIGLAYMVMLAVMSFNAGVFLVAIAGHSIGFLLFGSRVANKSTAVGSEKNSDLPRMTC